MPISMNEFSEKGTVPQRIDFTGTKTKNIKALLSENPDSAYNLSELATAAEVDGNDKAQAKNLVALMAGLKRKGKVEVKSVDGIKYYAGIKEE